jgi:hypothetical protein
MDSERIPSQPQRRTSRGAGTGADPLIRFGREMFELWLIGACHHAVVVQPVAVSGSLGRWSLALCFAASATCFGQWCKPIPPRNHAPCRGRVPPPTAHRLLLEVNVSQRFSLNELRNCNADLRRMLDRARSSCDRDSVIQRWRWVAVSSSAPSLQDDEKDESPAHQPELATPQSRLVPRKTYPN